MIRLKEYFENHLTPITDTFITEEKGLKKRLEDYDTINVPLKDGTTYTIDMRNLIQEQERAKAALSHLQPFFSGLISSIRYVYTFRVDTQATDGCNIFVNPYFTDKLSFEEKVFVLAHEIMHCVCNHLRREKIAGFNDHTRANCAGDFEANVTLMDWGLVSKSTLEHIGALLKEKYRGDGFEKIYMDDDCEKAAEQQKGKKNNKAQEKPEKITHSQDYKDGWAQALKDFRDGKIKI